MEKQLILNEGEIIFVRSSGWLAKLIQLAQNFANYLNFQKREKQFNHCALGIKDGLCAEALAQGIKIQPMAEAYGKAKKKELLIYSLGLTDEQKQRFTEFALAFEHTPYQYDNFILHLKSIFKKGFVWPENEFDAKRALYCSEYAAMIIYEVTKDPAFRYWWKLRPDQILDIAQTRTKWKLERRYVL